MSEPWKFVAGSEGRRAALALARRVAGAECPVLLLGPTGVGKDVLASDLHRHGPRADKPFVALNCAAITPTLFESELFGHARGAYTSATSPKTGLVEIADGGTLFLDEIGELPLEAQAKLLRFLDKGVFWPVGSTRERTADVRIIAATNRDLPSLIAASDAFRPDLYFRLSVVTIALPPLGTADVRLLARVMAEAATRPEAALPPSEIEALQELAAARTFAGGARELRNAVERCLVLRQPGESIERAWRAVVGAAVTPPPEAAAPSPQSTVTGPLGDQIVGALDDLLFLSAAHEARDVRELAARLDRSLQAVYDRLRRMKIPPRDLRDPATVERALAEARRTLAPHLSRIQALLKS